VEGLSVWPCSYALSANIQPASASGIHHRCSGVHMAGTIGRSTLSMKWILPDPESLPSRANTARVDYSGWILTSWSIPESNGTYVTVAQVPPGKIPTITCLRDRRLHPPGANMSCWSAIDNEQRLSIPPSRKAPSWPTTDNRLTRQSKEIHRERLGADLDLSQLLEPSDLLAERFRGPPARRLWPGRTGARGAYIAASTRAGDRGRTATTLAS